MNRRAGFLVVLVLAIAGTGFVIHRISDARSAANRVTCINNLKKLHYGLDIYEATFKSFPPGTQCTSDLPPEKRLSWLVLAGRIAFCDGPEVLIVDFEKAWDSAENRDVKAKYYATNADRERRWTDPYTFGPVVELQCPGHPSHAVNMPSLTHYVGIAGVGENAAVSLAGDPLNGVFGYDRKTRREDIKDGLANTVMVVETAFNNGPWTAGGPATVRGVVPKPQPFIGNGMQFGGMHPSGCMVLFADGSVRLLQDTVDPNVFMALATIAGGENGGAIGFE